MEDVPITLKRYAHAQGWPIRIYRDVRHCLKPCNNRIKLMFVTDQNLTDIIRATHGNDASTVAMWKRTMKEYPEDKVMLLNAPCRLQIATASTLTTRILSRDPTMPFECSSCGLMQVIRAPVSCPSCDREVCYECHIETVKQDVLCVLDVHRQTGIKRNPINIQCPACHYELVGSWGDVYKAISYHCNPFSIVFLSRNWGLISLFFLHKYAPAHLIDQRRDRNIRVQN